MLENDAEQFADMFDVLLDANNYPVLFTSFLERIEQELLQLYYYMH